MTEAERGVAVQTMIRVCTRIAEGDYSTVDDLFAISGQGAATPGADDAVSADLAALAEAFGTMVVKLEVREFDLTQTIDDLRETQRQLEHARAQLAVENQTLRRKVDQLSIEIDKTKKDREVSEITETDYFRELQVKAQQMRRRARFDADADASDADQPGEGSAREGLAGEGSAGRGPVR